MGPQILIPISMFLMIFGIFYLIYSTRNRERLALIEKGLDASIFIQGGGNGVAMWKIFILNTAYLLIGIGLGLFIALILTTYTTLPNAVYPATIIFMAGIGLLVGFNKAKYLEKE